MGRTLLDILTYLCGLQKIDLCSWEGWERPNSDIPEQFRGVWYVHDMKGNAVVTIDLKFSISSHLLRTARRASTPLIHGATIKVFSIR